MGYRNSNNVFLKTLKKYHLLIFQHLEIDEILKLSEVEADLCNIISGCSHCMSQLCVHINLDKFAKTKDLRNFLSTQNKRKYRNLMLTCSNDFDMSILCVKICETFARSITTLEVSGMRLRDDVGDIEIKVPNLMTLKVGSSSVKALILLLKMSQVRQKLIINDMCEAIDDYHIANLLMQYKSIVLLNVNLASITNLDFVFNDFNDFKYECDQINDFSGIAGLFENVLNVTELIVRKRNGFGYKLAVQRTRHENYGKLAPNMFERRYTQQDVSFLVGKFARKRQKLDTLDRNSSFPSSNFSISLETDDLRWTVLEKLASALKKLRSLSIYEIADAKKIEFFKNFKHLELITIVAHDDLETQIHYRREEFEIKSSIDPLMHLDQDLRPLIFQHFQLDDYLQASSVSAKWNTIVSEHPKFNEKVIFTLKNADLTENQVEFIKASKKFTQNIDFACGNDQKVGPQVLKVIHHFSQFLTELSFTEVRLKGNKVMNFLIFPQLRVLKLKRVDENFCKSIFEHMTTLRVLSLYGMPFTKKYLYRIPNQQRLEKLFLRECSFESFDGDRGDFEFKCLDYLEISFNQANAWKNSANITGVENFLYASTLKNVRNFKFSGLRYKLFQKFIDKLVNLENLEIGSFWRSDLKKMDTYTMKINLYVPNFYYLDEFSWRKRFRKIQTICASSIEKESPQFDETDRNFKKLMKVSGSKMIKSRVYQIEQLPTNSLDPLVVLPEHIHDLVFQHFNTKDALNAREVSQSWKFFCGQEKKLMEKITLRLTSSLIREDREVIEETTHRYQVAICHSSRLNMLMNFSKSLRKLAVIMDNNEKFTDIGLDFSNLEMVKVRSSSAFGTFGRTSNILMCFGRCKKLKTFIVKDQIQDEDFNPLMRILRHNPQVVDLRLENVRGYQNFFLEDISDLVDFRLKKFSFGIPSSETISGTIFENNLLKFIKAQQETLEELRLSHSSAKIMNEVIPNFKLLKNVYTTYFIGFNELNCLASRSIEKFLIPLSTHDGCQAFITRLPFVKFVFVQGLDYEVLEAMVLQLPYLKVLSFNNERNNCTRRYQQIIADNDYVNRNVTFVQVERLKFEALTFEKMFGRREEEFDD